MVQQGPEQTLLETFLRFWAWSVRRFLAKFETQDTFDHDKGQKSAISGRRLHWRLSTGFFAFSPVFMYNLVRGAP